MEVHEKYPIACEFVKFTDWDDFLILARDLGKNGLTYHSFMNKLPDKLNKYFQEHSFILIFPVQVGVNGLGQMEGGVETIKGSISQIFRRK